MSPTTRGPLRRLVDSPLGAFPLIALVFSLLIVIGVLWIRPRFERSVRDQVAAQLVVTRDASVGSLSAWFATTAHALELATASEPVRAQVARCMTSAGCDAQIATIVRPYTAAVGIRDVVVVDPHGNVRGVVGERGAEWKAPPDLVASIARMSIDRVTMLPPVLESGHPTLWAAIRTAGGVLLCELAIDQINTLLTAARAGHSGETYAFDREGRFVSESRFGTQLRAAGLLDGAQTTLVVDVRDPGVDLTRGERAALPRAQQPLTTMARDAIAGGTGVSIDGYRDYRGVVVVGAWQWIPALGIGVATEVDEGEAFASTHLVYSSFRWLLGILGLACVALIVGAIFLGRLRARARQAQVLAEHFGQYRIARKLAEGGMGAVYLAHHALLRRPAVIKLVRPDRTTPEAVARFEQEAQLTSALAHGNTVSVYDYGITDSGVAYCVMEYIDGVDLGQLVTRFGPLPEERVVHFMRQLCGSLVEAHAMGLVHRDIKPANLMVARRGGASDTLKVLDFGIARSFKANRSGMTENQVLLGTPEYMAPELFESGAGASPQSDLYALASTAYFLLTGTTVFDGETDVARAHLLQSPQAPSERRGHPVNRELEALLLSCLAKRREGRPRSAAALLALLDRIVVARPWTEERASEWWDENQAGIEAMRSVQSAAERPPTVRKLQLKRR